MQLTPVFPSAHPYLAKMIGQGPTPDGTICLDHAEEGNDEEYLTASGNNNRCYDKETASSVSTSSDGRKSPPTTIRTYPVRYFLLLLFIALSMSNAFQWIEYAIIESVVTDFWHVSTFWVNCTSTVYMGCYIIGIVPATWLLDNYGLRPCLIVASLGNALGSWIKCLSIDPSLFWVSMVGQTIVASSQLFILNIPPLLAATWFPASDVTKTTAYGVFGNQVGIALGFLIPPLLVPGRSVPQPNGTTTTMASVMESNFTTTTFAPTPEPSTFDIDATAHGLRILFYSVSVITSLIFLLIVAFFESKPRHPPSEAQAYAQTLTGEQSFGKSILSLFTNVNFLLLFVSYGLNTGVFYAVSSVLSQMITRAIGANYVQEAGYLGLTITLAGIVGSIVCGYILAYSKQFKGVTLFVYICSLLGTIAFTVGLEVQSIPLLFAVSALLGFFMTGYLPIGFEFAAEVSFPQPEGTSAGLLNASAQVRVTVHCTKNPTNPFLPHIQIFGIIFTFGSSPIIESYGHLYANIFFIGALLVGAILTALVKSDLRRQNAHLSINDNRRQSNVPAALRHNSITCLT